MDQKQLQEISFREILESGRDVIFNHILSNPIPVTSEQMRILVNFEAALTTLTTRLKDAEGKSKDELMDLAKKALDF